MTHSPEINHTKAQVPFEKKTMAQVLHCESGQLILNIERTSGCSGCQQQSSCAHRQAENMLNKNITLSIESTKQYSVGQYIDIDIDEKTLLISAFLIYCVPTIIMIITALIASLVTTNQLIIFIISLISLLSTLFLIKKYSKNYSQNVLKKIEIKE